MKKLLSIIVLPLLVGYVVFAAIAFCDEPEDQVCKGVKLEMRDSLETGYMTTRDVVALLAMKGLDPTGRLLDEISLSAMEEALETSPLIRNSECYKMVNGHVVVMVECRRPILRVIANGGDSYYLDEDGELIEHISKAVYLPIATGHITKDFAKKELLALARYLRDNELWNAQIEQICVTSRGEVELIPRVGDHIIVLGRPGDYAEKFGKLQTFYERALGEVGWGRYSHINIDYNNQVVATKNRNQ